MIQQVKKILSPALKSYNHDLSKRWRIEWQEENPRTKRIERKVTYGHINKGRTVSERLAYADAILKELICDEVIFKPGKKHCENILLKTYDLCRIHWRTATARAYKTIIHVFLDFLDGKNPEDVNADDINQFIIYLKDIDSSQHKLLKYVTRIKTIYNKAADYNLIKTNPVPILKQKKPKAKSLLFFNDYQIDLIKNAHMPGELWLGIQLLFYCFIRPGEARLLKLSNINLQYDFIEIPSNVSKNNRSQKVAIPYQLKSELSKLIKYNPDHYLIGKNGIPGKNPIPEKRIYNLHKNLLKKLDIHGNYSLYSWKHTGVVKVVKSGINIKDLQLQLRHHSLDMVNEYLKNLGVLDSEDLKNRFPTL